MVLLSICLIFCQLQPGVAYKTVAYKKSVYVLIAFIEKFNKFFLITYQSVVFLNRKKFVGEVTVVQNVLFVIVGFV